MAERWIDSLGDTLFFLRDRVERLIPRVRDAIDQAARKEELDRRRERLREWAAAWKSPRKALKNNTALVSVVLIAAIVGIVYLCYRQIAPAQQYGDTWFYDTNTKEVFRARDQIPPISHGGTAGAGVRAYVFSCGECWEKGNRFVGYLETFPAQAQAALANPSGYAGVGDNAALAEAMVQQPGDKAWVKITSEEGVAAVNAFRSHCGEGVRAKPCED